MKNTLEIVKIEDGGPVIVTIELTTKQMKRYRQLESEASKYIHAQLPIPAKVESEIYSLWGMKVPEPATIHNRTGR